MVVHGRRAAGADQGREPGAGGGVLDLLVHERPDRIQLDQPLEEVACCASPRRSPLVEVVVAVDEPRRGEATTAVYAPGVCRCFFRRATLADGQDPVPLRHDVARGVLRARPSTVAMAQFSRTALLAHASDQWAARRTASRIFSYPVQRHRLPASASRTSASLGSGFLCSRSWVATMKPGCRNRTARPRQRKPAAPGAARSPGQPLDRDDLALLGLSG